MLFIKRVTQTVLLLFVLVSLGIAFADAIGMRSGSPSILDQPHPTISKSPVVAYCFHTNTRCTTCRAIETNAKNSLRHAIADGFVEWRVINFQDPGNKHLAREYALEFSSIVLVEAGSGLHGRWKNLDRVWELNEDPVAFENYVQSELATFMKARP